MIPVGVHAWKVERTHRPATAHVPAWRSRSAVVSLGLLWVQRFSLALVLVLGSMQRVAPAISVLDSTAAVVSARAALDSDASLHHSRPLPERQCQAVDKRAAYEPELTECANAEDDMPDCAWFVCASCSTPYRAEHVLRSADVARAVQRLVEAARPRGPPRV
jgi:hypothetical protein